MARNIYNDQFYSSLNMNGYTFMQYYYRLLEIAIFCYKWSGMPEEIDEQFLEYALTAYGMALFYRDEEVGKYIALTTTIGGNQSIYRIPNRRIAYAPGYNYECNSENSVLIFNNFMRTGMLLDIEMFARRLYDLDRTIDVNAHAQKTPIALVSNQNAKLSIENAYKDFVGNKPVIFVTKEDVQQAFKAIDTKAEFKGRELWELKTNLWNECMTYFGINNSVINKRERTLTNEIEYSQSGVYACRRPRTVMRERACKEINRMFGLSVSVEFDEEFLPDMPGATREQYEEVDKMEMEVSE